MSTGNAVIVQEQQQISSLFSSFVEQQEQLHASPLSQLHDKLKHLAEGNTTRIGYVGILKEASVLAQGVFAKYTKSKQYGMA